MNFLLFEKKFLADIDPVFTIRYTFRRFNFIKFDMIFGPFPPVFVEKLKLLLDQENAPYKISYSPEDLNNINELNRNRNPTAYPSFSGTHDLLYIEIESEHLLIIKSELEKMGSLILQKYNGELEEPVEFLCSECDYISADQVLCPKHNIRLLGFSDWSKVKTLQKSKLDKRVALWIFASIGLFALIAYLTRINSSLIGTQTEYYSSRDANNKTSRNMNNDYNKCTDSCYNQFKNDVKQANACYQVCR